MAKKIIKDEKIEKHVKKIYKATTPFRLKLYDFLQVVKRGYNETSWLLYLTTAMGILTSFFNLQLSGAAAWLFFFIFFYLIGKFFIDFEKEVKEEIKKALLKYLEKSSSDFDIVEFCKKSEKPVKILFLGPNGSGKTTTIAKIAKMLKENNLRCVFAASDTFRAAAIEQLEIHAKNLGIKVIKHEYGSDPASVAFDAVEHAKANSIDVVLIDTAGRQETNRNLIEEMKKISRVIKPNLKIFVVESIAGNSLIEQIREFKKNVGIDGIILTKLDCDEKGGAILGISKLTDIPIYYISYGQEYDKIEKYEPARFLERILS
jgi:fused signal recognition particle receptor